MKIIMSIKAVLLLPGFLVIVMSHSAYAGSTSGNPAKTIKSSIADTQVRAELAQLVALLTDGVATGWPEDKPIPINYAPLSGAGARDAVVVFSMAGYDGRNGTEQFLAVFVETDHSGWSPDWKPHPYHLAALIRIGHDFDRIFDADSVTVNAKGIIMLKGKRWNGDAHCCPHEPISAQFKFDDFTLTEISPTKSGSAAP